MKAEIRKILADKTETLEDGRVVIVPDFSQLDDLVDDLYTLFSLQGVSSSLTDIDKNKLIDDFYWLNLQNLSGREDFEEAFKLGIEVGVNELSEKLNV